MHSYVYIVIGLLILWLLRKYFFNAPIYTKKIELAWKTAIVTGSSAGIGKEIAFDLLRQGASVYFACRDEKKTRQVISTIPNPEERARATFIKLDLGNVNSIKSFNNEFRRQCMDELDILVNNAGFINDYFELQNGIESMLMTNHIGHKILTLLLLDKLSREESRIINLASFGHFFSNYSVEELQRLEKNLDFAGEGEGFGYKRSFVQYGNTKLANIYFTQYLAEKLPSKYPNIKIGCNHPGGVNTEFNRYLVNIPFIFKPFLWFIFFPLMWYFSKTSFVGAQSSFVHIYQDFEEFENGVYLEDCRKGSLSNIAKDENVRTEFMKYSWMLVDKVNDGKFNLERL